MTNKTKLEIAKDKIQSSPTVKLVIIGLITLILLVPAAMIQSIIQERESMNRSAIMEVSDKWAHAQDIVGPILTIPYTKEYTVNDELRYSNHKLNILPDQLNIEGKVLPKKLRRGIYEVVVYSSKLDLSGEFNIDEIVKSLTAHEVLWGDAFVTLGISDLRGIKNKLSINWNGSDKAVRPGSKIGAIIPSGVTINTPFDLIEEHKEISFDLQLDLNGSTNLSFVPVGGVTTTNISSPWDAPSFNGSFLPESREVGPEGFVAQWQTLELNRNYPQSWNDTEVSHELLASKFGMDLLLPIDDYQKSMRSAKYAILLLSLTFLVFFLVEIMNHRRIHPFQYTLVGLALCLFYILLVSVSEHFDFNMAYLISAIAIVVMIGSYSLSVFSNKKMTLVLVLILSALYSFLFVTLQLADFALIMGAVGLFVILGATMYFTRKIDWYHIGNSSPIIETDTIVNAK